MKKTLERINLPRIVCTNLCGSHHSPMHRKVVGIIIMLTGIGIMHVFTLFHIEIIQYIGETVGGALHGTGLIPFIHNLDKLTDES